MRLTPEEYNPIYTHRRTNNIYPVCIVYIPIERKRELSYFKDWPRSFGDYDEIYLVGNNILEFFGYELFRLTGRECMVDLWALKRAFKLSKNSPPQT